MDKKYVLDEKWIKASILGTIWAAFEIVLGSFLHNFKIPFSSNALTAIGIIILISISYIWTDKGLFWRAGIICAIMKTMSPSAVIFGPFIAIISEAALLEISVRLFGRTVIGFAVGAMLSMSWNLFQKIINFIIFYGFNIVEVYTDLLLYARKQLNVNFDLTWLPILVLFTVYCLLGLLSAIVGMKVGRKLLDQPLDNQLNNRPLSFIGQKNGTTNGFDHSLLWLFINSFLMIGSLVLLNFTSWVFWSITISVVVTIWVLRYKRALNQLSRPRFWIYFVLITMVTAFVFTKMESGRFLEGLLAGIQMNFRAAIIILGFSVIGTELYNPRVRAFFLKTSFKQLPMALELSFGSLPSMISHIPEFKVFIKNPVSVVHQIVSQAEFRLAEIKRRSIKTVVLISGGIEKGKTSLVKEIIQELKQNNISVGGLFSPRIMEGETTVGYDVVDIMTNEQTGFLRIANDKNSCNIGRFTILTKGLEAGLHALNVVNNSNNQFIIIDEVGNLELENQGWAPKIEELLKNSESHLLITVRDNLAERIIQKWNLNDYSIVKIAEIDDVKISDLILELL